MDEKSNLIGQRFGRLTVLRKYGQVCFCQCDCGKTVAVLTGRLKNRDTRSCGCLRETHGDSETRRLYYIWRDMISRCYDRNHRDYYHYGGRDIQVCPEWRESCTAFKSWALSHGYSDSLTIDRIDNNGNYEPSNCRWITGSENTKRQFQ